ncbi:MAG TPA: PAS domain S-box protein [Chthoniobacterales bacterium]
MARVEQTAGIFSLSCASFDDHRRLVDWDAGFSSEFAIVEEHLLSGAPFGEILRFAFERDRVTRIVLPEKGFEGEQMKGWGEGLGKAEPFEYRNGDRTVQVRESRTVSGGILRMAMDVTAGRQTRLSAAPALEKPGALPRDQGKGLSHAEAELLRSATLQTSQTILRLRLRADQALKESEARFRTMANVLPQLVWTAQADGYIVWYNQRWYDYTGTTPQQMEGWGWQVVHDPAVLPVVMKQWQGSIATGQPFEMEFPLRGADGRFRLFLTRIMPLKDAEGRVLQWFGTNTDVSQRVEMQERNVQLAALVEAAEDAIIGNSLDGTITSWNGGAGRLFGYTPAEMIGQPVWRIIPPARLEEDNQNLLRLKRGERVEPYETVRRHKEGRLIEVSLSLSPIQDAQGRIIGASKIVRDITERKRAEESMRHAHEQLREQASVLELAPVLVRDMNDRIVQWNLGADRLYGFSKTEALGQVSHELFHTEFPQPLAQIEGTLHETGRWEGELVHRKHNGERLVVGSQWVLHRDPAGNPVRILEINTDLTARQAAEQALRELNAQLEQRVRQRTEELAAKNALFDTVLNRMAESVIVTDAGGRFLFLNASAARLYGSAAPDPSIQDWADRLEVFLPGEEQPSRFEDWPQVRAIRGENVVDLEVKVRDVRTGALSWVLVNACPLGKEREARSGSVAVVHDITERRKAEEVLRERERRFRTLLESLPQLIWTSWAAGSNYYVSRQWVEYTGIPAAQQWGNGWMEQLHPDDRQRVQDAWLGTAQAEHTYDIEYRLRRADGMYRWFKTRGVPIHNDAGQLVEWFGSCTDVEDLKRAEQEIHALNAELEQRVLDRVADLTRAQEALEVRNLDLQQFAYVASHDLKTPLRTISGFVELLQTNYGGQLDAQGADWIRRVSEGAHRLETLIDNLLLYSRLDSQAEAFAPVDCRAVVEEARQGLEALIHESGAEVAAGDLPNVMGDRTQLAQLFQNLIANGIKYRGASRPRIQVAATEAKGGWVFSVTDNGIGVDPKHHERIFELFRRLHTQKEYPGNGIGLTVCRRIVGRHGGRIWLHSEPGKGCAFFFTLSPQTETNP